MSPSRTPVGDFLAALVAFLAPGAALVALAVAPGSEGGSWVTPGEWIASAMASIVASAAGEARAQRKVLVEVRKQPAEQPATEAHPEAGTSVR